MPAIIYGLLCMAAHAQDLKIDRVSVVFGDGVVGPESQYRVNYMGDYRDKKVPGGWLESTEKPLAGMAGARVDFSGPWVGDAPREVEIAYRLRIKVRGAPTITDAATGKRIEASVGSDGYLVLPARTAKTALSVSFPDKDQSIGFATLWPYRFSLTPGDRVDFRIEGIRLRYCDGRP